MTLGMDAFGRVLVVVYTWRSERVRLISARKAMAGERQNYEGEAMKQREYDFSRAKRGPVIRRRREKRGSRFGWTKILWAGSANRSIKAGGGNYQSLINDALRQYLANKQEPLEEALRRVVREEIRRVS